MPLTIAERNQSPTVSLGPNPSAERSYIILGTDNELEARMGLEAASPLTYDFYGDGLSVIPRTRVGVELVDSNAQGGLWDGFVDYGVLQLEGESTFQFETGGGNQHIEVSRLTIGRYAVTGTAPNHKGTIGVSGAPGSKSAQGCDIVVPVYQFSETHYFSPLFVNGAYKASLHSLTGKVNDSAFRGFQAGEVLFMGAAGARRGTNPWEVVFRFAASENESDMTVGDITGIVKNGWEYLWVETREIEDSASHTLVKEPFAAHVEQVYEEGDFSGLGIGTA